MKNKNEDIGKKIFQKNLMSFRKIAGWTVEELANQIGVTKQTVSNLELGNVTMSTVQYIALRAVFQMHIEETNDETLRTVLDVMDSLLEHSEECDAEKLEALDTTVTVIASSANSGVKGEELNKLINNLLKAGGYVGAALLPGAIFGAAGIAAGAVGVAGIAAAPIAGPVAAGIAAVAPWLKRIVKKR